MSDQESAALGVAKGQERIVLSELLRWPEQLDEVASVLRPEDFVWHHHGLIYRVLLELVQRGVPVTLETVAHELHQRKLVDDVGGYGEFSVLWDASPGGGNLAYFAKIVRERARVRRLNEVAGQITQMTSGVDGPADELQERAESLILSVGKQGQVAGTRTLKEGIELACDRINERARQDTSLRGLATGFIDLDDKTGGLQDGEQTIVAARPGVGKTAFGLQVTRHVALTLGQPVFFVSLEMSLVELAERLLCSEGRLDGLRLRRGVVSSDDGHQIAVARAALVKANVHLDDYPYQTMSRIAANARRLKRQQKIRLVVVDYLQLIEPENRRDPRHEQVAQVSRRLKFLARDLKLPVLALAQLNRAVEGRKGDRPRLSDLRESGEIEQNADVVLLLHQEAEKSREVEVIIGKQRNGPKGAVTLAFEPEFTRFSNYAPGPPLGS
jgi:replicative DNA helicase